MLRRLGTKIADAIEFLLDVLNWWDDKPTSKEFERKMLRPEFAPPKNRLPRD